MQGAKAFILPGIAALLLLVYYVWRAMSGGPEPAPVPAGPSGASGGSPTAPATPGAVKTSGGASSPTPRPSDATEGAGTTDAGSVSGSTG